MHNKFLYTAICSSILMITSITYAYAETDKCNLNRSTVENFNCDGSATLTEATVREKISVKGALNANNVYLNSVEVTGATNITESQVKGDATVSGELSAKRTSFRGNLTINFNTATLDSSNVKKSITMHGDKNPILELRCTHIYGDIQFQGMPGVVKKSSHSVINGQVKNGKVETITDDHCDNDNYNDHDKDHDNND